MALDALDLAIQPGEVMCMLGANGAGKTTTINLFLGFIEPTSGQALVDGVDVMSDPIGSKRHLAYIPEQVALYPALTGLENLRFLSALPRSLRTRACPQARRIGTQSPERLRESPAQPAPRARAPR